MSINFLKKKKKENQNFEIEKRKIKLNKSENTAEKRKWQKDCVHYTDVCYLFVGILNTMYFLFGLTTAKFPMRKF